MSLRRALATPLFLIGSLFAVSLAQAFEITPVGTLQVSYLASPPYSASGTGWGYGALFSQFIQPDLQIETGFLYLARKVNIGLQPVNSETYFYEEIPLMVRVQPKGSHFSFGFGGYYAHAVGNFQTELPGATAPTYVSYETAQISRQDYGVVGAIGLRWPLVNRTQLYTDARFAVGIKNIDDSGGQGLRWREYFQAILGLSFSL